MVRTLIVVLEATLAVKIRCYIAVSFEQTIASEVYNNFLCVDSLHKGYKRCCGIKIHVTCNTALQTNIKKKTFCLA